MSEIPRPQTLGEILDRTIQIYRSRFFLLFGISVIPTGAVLVIVSAAILVLVWSGRESASGTRGVIAIAFIVIAALISVPVIVAATALAEAAVNDAANRCHSGERITLRASYAAIWKRGWRYIWLYVLHALAVWGVPIAVFFVLMLLSALIAALVGGSPSAGVAFGLLIFLAAMVLLAYAIWMALRLSLAFPACVVEQATAWTAVKRSGKLSMGTRGRIFVLYLLGWVLLYILTFGISIVLFLPVLLIPAMQKTQNSDLLGQIILFVYYAVTFGVQALLKPVYGIALVLFYYDQRIRQEGYDIEWMMQRAGLVAPAAADGGSALHAQAAVEPAEPAAEVAQSAEWTEGAERSASGIAEVSVSAGEGSEQNEPQVAAREEPQ